MPRPQIREWSGQLFKKQLNAVLDYLESSGSGGGGGPVAWADIDDKPTTFAPSAHTHPAADVTGTKTASFISDFASAVAGLITGKADTAHTHVVADITDWLSSLRSALFGFTSTVGSGTTITLTAASNDTHIITGGTNQTVVLPDVTTLTLGRTFRIKNHMSSGFSVTVQSSGLNAVGGAVANGMDAIYTVIALTGTDDTPWLWRFDGARTRTGSGNLVFSSAPTIASPIFTGVPVFPAGVVGGASARIPHGVAPTAPVDGDVWTETTGMYARINGVTVGPFGSGGGSSPLAGTATVTPTLNSSEWRETVAAVGVTGASRIVPVLGAFADTDENDPEFLDIGAISAIPGTDAITFVLNFLTPTSGPIKLNWSVL